MVSRMTGVPVEHLDNPRKEMAENDLVVANDSLIKLGLEPTRLSDGLMEEVVESPGAQGPLRHEPHRLLVALGTPIAAE